MHSDSHVSSRAAASPTEPAGPAPAWAVVPDPDDHATWPARLEGYRAPSRQAPGGRAAIAPGMLKTRGLRCANGSITIALTGGLLLIWNDSVILGMVLKPLLILGLLMSALWVDEWLRDRSEVATARKLSRHARARDRRGRPRAKGSERRVASRTAESAEFS